jgi:hypothetical protein
LKEIQAVTSYYYRERPKRIQKTTVAAAGPENLIRRSGTGAVILKALQIRRGLGYDGNPILIEREPETGYAEFQTPFSGDRRSHLHDLMVEPGRSGR